MIRKLGVLFVAAMVLTGLVAPSALAGVTGPVYQYGATTALHNVGFGANVDLVENGVNYDNRDVWFQGQENGATMWGGPNVPKAQKQWRFCWHFVPPQTDIATVRLDVLWDGVELFHHDVDLLPHAHSDGQRWFVGVICYAGLAPSVADRVQIRVRLLAQGPGNVFGIYKTSIQEETP